MRIPTKIQIDNAYNSISKVAHRTPVLTSSSVNKILGCKAYFKCENFQKVGAFKFRGASNAVFNLSDKLAKKGVCTHSSGNHAAAIALAAKLRGIKANIVMPNNAPAIKRKAVEGYGAIITTCKPTQADREQTLEQIQKETGATFIHPYNNYDVICGQGTAALELLQDYPNLNTILTPVGGGGLFSGTLIYTKECFPNITVYAGEPQNADDAFRSLKDGKLHPSINPDTIADGLRTSLSPLTFNIIQNYANGIITVPENSIILAMRLIWERMKIIIEPSSATTLAVILKHKAQFRDQKTALIISGGNVDLNRLPF